MTLFLYPSTQSPLHRTEAAPSVQRTTLAESSLVNLFSKEQTDSQKSSILLKVTQQKEGKNVGQSSFFAALAMRSKLAEISDRQCLQIRWVTLKPWSGATKKEDQTFCEVCFTVCFTHRPQSVLPAPRKQGSVFSV